MEIAGFNIIKSCFFKRPTLIVARDLIDKYLITNREEIICGGRIVEVEAYTGIDDKASHASVGITKRNKIMYDCPGYIYVYMIYGIHYCFNVVTEKKNIPGAVLIRAIEPELGIKAMKTRRKRNNLLELTSGPAKLTQALSIDISDNNEKLSEKDICIMDDGRKSRKISCGSRIGITKSRHLNYRFYVKGNKYVS